MVLTAIGILILAFVVYKIGHGQGQIVCLHKLGKKTITMYATDEQIKCGFTHAERHILSLHSNGSQNKPVKVIFEEEL